jgi:DNA-binding response OmpR family regulator
MEATSISRKILVVDDEEPIRLLYQQELKDEGYAVETAANAQAAFDVLEKAAIDLVIMDIKMPGMNGIEAMQKIVGKGKNIPIIINSGYPHFKESYLTWIADEYVVKSADLQELKDKIKHTLLFSEYEGSH